MRVATKFGCAGLAFGLLAGPARADVTADQAAAVQKQLQDWVAGVVGPTVQVPPLPLKLLPEGDHYRIEVDLAPMATSAGITLEGGPWTGTARPLDANRWSIDNLKAPSPLKVINASGPPELRGTVTLAVDEQENHAIYDTTLATTSSADGHAKGMTQTIDTAAGQQSAKIASITWHQASQPGDGGRQNVTMEGTIEGMSTTQTGKEGPVAMDIDRARLTGHADGVDFGGIGSLLRSTLALGKLMGDAPPPPSGLTPAQADATKAVIRAFGELLTLVDFDETLEGMHIKAAAFSGQLAKVSLGGGFGAPKGDSEVHLRFAMEGISSPDLPPGPLLDFVPRRIAFSPHVSGLQKADLIQLLSTAADSPNGDMSQATAQGMAMLDKTPVNVGVDDLIIDIGVAKLTGSGGLDVSSPTDLSGEAELRLTGFDALMRKVNAAQETKMAAPVLIFLKGISEQDGADMVWKVKYEDDKVTVNGTDLTGMIPGK